MNRRAMQGTALAVVVVLLGAAGATTLHGPVSATVQTPTVVTVAGFDAAQGHRLHSTP